MPTIRQRIIELLEGEELGAREISQTVRISEKEVYEHLDHVARSLKGQGRKLILQPSECLSCGYIFRDRKRLTPPGRCPQCRATHIQPPQYRIG